MPRRVLRLLLAFVMIATVFSGVTVLTAAPAHADGCYTWSRNLS